MKRSLVVICCFLEFPQENVGVSKVWVGPSLCSPVAEFLGYLQPLLMEVNGPRKVAKQVVNVAWKKNNNTSKLTMNLILKACIKTSIQIEG